MFSSLPLILPLVKLHYMCYLYVHSFFKYDLLLLAQLVKSHHANKLVQGRNLHLTQLYL